MKATFYLPAHPSYFDDEYSQEEVERAIRVLDKVQLNGAILNHSWLKPFDHEFVLLREPGKSVTVVFDSAGYAGDGRGVEQYRRSANHDLGIYVHNLMDIMKGIRNGMPYEE
jgi:hypothetical protein